MYFLWSPVTESYLDLPPDTSWKWLRSWGCHPTELFPSLATSNTMTSVMNSVMTSVMNSVMTSVDTRRPFAVKGAGNHQLINSGKYVFIIKYLFKEYTDKKEEFFFLIIHEEIQNWSGAQSCVRKAFLIIYEEMRKYLAIYEEAVCHIWLCTRSHLNFLTSEENFLFLSVYTVQKLL